jgi:hypothetical protein
MVSGWDIADSSRRTALPSEDPRDARQIHRVLVVDAPSCFPQDQTGIGKRATDQRLSSSYPPGNAARAMTDAVRSGAPLGAGESVAGQCRAAPMTITATGERTAQTADTANARPGEQPTTSNWAM